MEAIKTVGLTKYYGSSRGIIELNLSVEAGECFGFIGPNGAGKSTTIRTLLGLISPTAGSAQIFGKDIGKEKEAILREVGYLPSEALFYPGMKVRAARRKQEHSPTACSSTHPEKWTNFPSATERRSPSCARSKAIRHC